MMGLCAHCDPSDQRTLTTVEKQKVVDSMMEEIYEEGATVIEQVCTSRQWQSAVSRYQTKCIECRGDHHRTRCCHCTRIISTEA
jgi:hypothetical protein